MELAGSLLDDLSAMGEEQAGFVFGNEALDQIACYHRLAGARRCHNEEPGGAGRKLALDLLDGGPLELVQDDAGAILLIIVGRLGIYSFDRAAKPIFFGSPVVLAGRGASTFSIRRLRPIRQSPEKPFGF
jgi:hypothetical protein